MGLYATFIDFTEAFDTVSRTGLWLILERLGCPPKFLQMVIELHENQRGQVRLNGDLRSDSRTTRRSRLLPATSTTGSGLTLLPTVWPRATQFPKLLPSSNWTGKIQSKIRDRGGRPALPPPPHQTFIFLQSLLMALSLPHRSGQPRARLQSTSTWTNFLNLRSRSQAMMTILV